MHADEPRESSVVMLGVEGARDKRERTKPTSRWIRQKRVGESVGNGVLVPHGHKHGTKSEM